ncbi:hypothetical protein BaRGS_00003977 [Batillaria attramentaria]|uniref:Uncharacterized protein n=1 Tax=Batillaria attramentaria TaxID=370345 RepID=A0ABD0LYY9_9CAEN
MADLPHSDLATDGAAEFRRRRVVATESETDKRLSEAESRVDSGIGYSLQSQDMNSLRSYIESHSDKDMAQQLSSDSRPASDFSTSSLQSRLSNLSIGGTDKTRDNQCDSGRVESGIYSLEEESRLSGLVESAFPEVHLQEPPSFEDCVITSEELEELFAQDEDGDTHLHMSIIHLLPEVSLKIIALAPHYEFLNIPNTLHQTPLHLAVATRQRVVARRLMGAGAAMDAPDHCGNTPLHIACREGMLDMVVTLLEPIYHHETLNNSYEIPFQPIPQDLSLRNYDGYTCAHLALQGGHLDVLQYLLAKGANINEQDGKSGRTLLHMAADMGYLKALDLLLRYQGLNLNARTYGGLTAISLAHGRRLTDMVERLCVAGADNIQLPEESGESTDEEMVDSVYDDICINGQPVLIN